VVHSYLINKAKLPGLTPFPDTVARQLKVMAVEYQKSGEVASLDSCIVDATYNYHFHTSSSCFGKAGKMQNHVNIAGTKQNTKPTTNADTAIHSGKRSKQLCRMHLRHP
jgi:hypothetical protein